MITRTVTKALNARTGLPDTTAPNPGFLLPGTSLEIVATVKGKSIEGNDTWYQASDGHFYWSGGFDRTISDSVLTIWQSNPKSQLINYNGLFEGLTTAMTANLGEGISIAVFDSGINASHRDFQMSHIEIAGCFNNKPGKDATDRSEDGHGTHTAGLIAAAAANTQGIIGIAPKSRIRIYKVLTDGGASDAEFLMNAITDILNSGPMPDIINMSLNIDLDSYQSSATLKAALDDISTKTICVAAAGEDNLLLAGSNGFLAPALHPNFISAGALSKAFFMANPAPVFNPRLDIIIPEFNIFSCSNKSNISYEQLNGSSMSAALTSGLIALLLSNDPSLKKNPSKVRSKLKSLAKPYSSAGFNSFSILI